MLHRHMINRSHQRRINKQSDDSMDYGTPSRRHPLLCDCRQTVVVSFVLNLLGLLHS